MTKASDNEFPSLLIKEGSAPSSPAAGDQRVYIDSSDHILKRKNSSGSVSSIEGLTNPMTTLEDIIKGGASGVPARLAKGPAGAFLGQFNGTVGWEGGTSFPGSPATGDRYWRSDLLMEGVYDGTRWLAAGPMQKATFASQDTLVPVSGTSNFVAIPAEQDFDWWLYDLHVAWYVATTNDGTHYWTWTVKRQTAGTTIVSGNTSAGSANTWSKSKNAIGALLGTSAVSMETALTKTSTPGTMYWGAYITYRLVLT